MCHLGLASCVQPRHDVAHTPHAAPPTRTHAHAHTQAGARVVYAVEASDMARWAAALAASNPAIGSRLRVLQGKVEEIELPEKVRAWVCCGSLVGLHLCACAL